MAESKPPSHRRNTRAMMAAPRCGARTRLGTSCQAPAVSGKRRCRMHGGAKGSGAPEGNHNALIHGLYSKETLERNRAMAEFLNEARKTLEQI